MKQKILLLILSIALVGGGSYAGYEYLYGGRCSPKGKCTACKNCTGCKHCYHNGGTCSVCRR